MKEHRGMRPQDIVILLKIVALGSRDWYFKDLAEQLNISNSEITESLNRSKIAGLLQDDKRSICKDELLEFLVYGLSYVFPIIPGSPTLGMPTAYSAPVLNRDFVVDDPYVWPKKRASKRGVAIRPLYRTVPQASENDERLYELLSLADALRINNGNDQVVELLVSRIRNGF